MFMYGCHNNRFPTEAKEFVWILSKLSPVLSYRKSTFSIEKSKVGTGRISVFQELKIRHSYTLETSFFGPGVLL